MQQLKNVSVQEENNLLMENANVHLINQFGTVKHASLVHKELILIQMRISAITAQKVLSEMQLPMSAALNTYDYFINHL
jgi:hypothetical protein